MSNYKLWIDIPYPGEKTPPRNPLEPLAEHWPLYYLLRNQGIFTDLTGKILKLDIKDPNTINFRNQLKIVQRAVSRITSRQKKIAIYWGSGAPTKQWTPIIDRLIDVYGVGPVTAARILASTHAGINDALVATWFLKFRYCVARPVQLDPNIRTVLVNPRHPTYPSGHAAVAGAASTILKYFFPAEADRLDNLAVECSLSRLYGGVHFIIDNFEGLRFGRQIGKIVVKALKQQTYFGIDPIDDPPVKFLNAQLPPPPYRQLIPFDFGNEFVNI